MAVYNVHHTDNRKDDISIDENKIDQSTDITLFGRKKLQYGEQMNQNVLHLLEHFSLPEIPNNPGNPNLSLASKDQTSALSFLSQPIQGQLWYNQTQECLFYWDDSFSKWLPLGMYDDLAANWGVIYSGQQLPKPVSEVTGRVFEYNECSWIVSPYNFPAQLTYMLCTSDEDANVTSIYSVDGNPSIVNGFASYLIVGIRGNINHGSIVPVPSATATPSITPTKTPTRTQMVTPTRTPTPLSLTPTPTPTLPAILGARIENPTAYNGVYDGPVNQQIYPNEFHYVPYPGFTGNAYKIFYRDPNIGGVPNNPWEPVNINGQNEYCIYVNPNPSPGSSFLDMTNTAINRIIFCSNDGVNGLFYRVKSASFVGSRVRIILDVDDTIFENYYNLPPKQVGPSPALTFNFDNMYTVNAFVASRWNGSDRDVFLPFALNPPTPYVQEFDLTVLGGRPPYTVTAIYSGAAATTSAVTYSGMVDQAINPAVPFSKVDTRNSSSNIGNRFLGLIDPSKPNVTPVSEGGASGYKVKGFLKADLFYPVKYGTAPETYWRDVYPGAGACYPEYMWHWAYNQYNQFGSPKETSGCANYTGYASYFNGGNNILNVEVTDSNNTKIIASFQAVWAFQTIDWRWVDKTIGFGYTMSGRPPGNIITSPGDYIYDIDLKVDNPLSSTAPSRRFSQLRYVFSVVAPTDATTAGSWNYSTASPLLSQNIIGNCFTPPPANHNVPSDIGMVHIGDPGMAGYTSQLTPYNGTTGTVQRIAITSYVSNRTRQPVNISSNPIYVYFYPTSTPNSFTWQAIDPNTGLNRNETDTSPLVPYDMQIKVTLPPGLTEPGTLRIPYIAVCYTSMASENCYSGAAGGLSNVLLNFDYNFTG